MQNVKSLDSIKYGKQCGIVIIVSCVVGCATKTAIARTIVLRAPTPPGRRRSGQQSSSGWSAERPADEKLTVWAYGDEDKWNVTICGAGDRIQRNFWIKHIVWALKTFQVAAVAKLNNNCQFVANQLPSNATNSLCWMIVEEVCQSSG